METTFSRLGFNMIAQAAHWFAGTQLRLQAASVAWHCCLFPLTGCQPQYKDHLDTDPSYKACLYSALCRGKTSPLMAPRLATSILSFRSAETGTALESLESLA